MRRAVPFVAALLVLAAIGAVVGWRLGRPASRAAGGGTSTGCGFADEFDGNGLDARWTWTGPSTESGEPGHAVENGDLRITAVNGADLHGQTLTAPRVLTEVRGDFSATAELEFPGGRNFQSAGLLVWSDERNFLRLERGFSDFAGIVFEYTENGSPHGIVEPAVGFRALRTDAVRLVLRLQRKGNEFTASWGRPEEEVLARIDAVTLPLGEVVRVGVAVVSLGRSPSGSTPPLDPLTVPFRSFTVAC